jgi:hypothetical protein
MRAIVSLMVYFHNISLLAADNLEKNYAGLFMSSANLHSVLARLQRPLSRYTSALGLPVLTPVANKIPISGTNRYCKHITITHTLGCRRVLSTNCNFPSTIVWYQGSGRLQTSLHSFGSIKPEPKLNAEVWTLLLSKIKGLEKVQDR